MLLGWWVARAPAVQAALLPRAEVRDLVNHEFQHYYSQYAATSFAAKVWTNNVWVAAESLIFGVLLGLPTLLVLFENAANVGVQGGLMVAHGKGGLFFSADPAARDAGAQRGVPGRGGRAAARLVHHRPRTAAARPGPGRGGAQRR